MTDTVGHTEPTVNRCSKYSKRVPSLTSKFNTVGCLGFRFARPHYAPSAKELHLPKTLSVGLCFTPRTYSVTPRVILHRLSLPFRLIHVSGGAGGATTNSSFLTVGPGNCITTLRLSSNRILARNPTVLRCLTSLHPRTGLTPTGNDFRHIHLRR